MDLIQQRNQGENDLAVAVVDLTWQRNQVVVVESSIEQNQLAVEAADLIEQNYQAFECWIALSHPQTKWRDLFLLER